MAFWNHLFYIYILLWLATIIFHIIHLNIIAMKCKIQIFVLRDHFYFLFTIRHLTKVTFVYFRQCISSTNKHWNISHEFLGKFTKSKFICSFFLLASRRLYKNRYLKEQIRWVPLIYIFNSLNIGNSTVTYTTIFAQRSGVSRTMWVPFEPMLNRHFSSRYLDVLCSTDQHDFTFIGEIRCNTNAWYKNFNILKVSNIYSIDVKIA